MSPPPLLAHSVLRAAEAMSSPLPPQSQEPKEAPFPPEIYVLPILLLTEIHAKHNPPGPYLSISKERATKYNWLC